MAAPFSQGFDFPVVVDRAHVAGERSGRERQAVRWFRESHRLARDNWTYRRQAWTFADPNQGPSEDYDGDWVGDVTRSGPENYHRPLGAEPR